MSTGRSAFVVGAVATLTILGGPIAAQQGTLVGTVTDEVTGNPVPRAEILIIGGGESRTAVTNEQGQYTALLPAGTYDLVVREILPYRADRFDNVGVPQGGTTTYDLTLRVMQLQGINVTVERSLDGQAPGDTPQTVFSVDSRDIVARPTTNLSDHLAVIPSVDIIKPGLQTQHVVLRGFNNIFSGALHMLTDHRLAGVPSLRVNLMHFIPSIEEDLDRIEVVLGPSSALYGPNTANGIIHFITKSPLDDQGTTVTLGGGERSVFQGAFRSAFLVNDDFGVKISGQYMRGDEWNYVDATEEAGRVGAAADPTACLLDKTTRGLSAEDAQIACNRIGDRNFTTERWGLEARADYRFADDGTIVGTYGRNTSSGIELTGLGAGQTSDWVYEFFQARVRKGSFFAQAYYNTSDAGDSFLLRDGVSLVDQSALLGAQAQYGFTLLDDRQEFTFGGDYFATRPDSRGTIYGTYDDDDDMNEWGGYLQSRTEITEQLDFVVAGRWDSHSVLPDDVFSTRGAFVFQPKEGHSLRLSYNRAFSTPTALNYFLDISGGVAPEDLGPLGYSTRAYGSGRDGWSLQDTPGTVHGMRSPFNPAGAGQLLGADATTLWQMAVNALFGAGAINAGEAALLGALTPTNSDITRLLFDTNTKTFSSMTGAVLDDLPPITEAYTETFEVGWTGLIEDWLSITADVYYMKKNDFVSPLVVETPLLFLDGADITAFLTPVVGGATAAVLGAGAAMIPLGVVSSGEVGAQGADLIASYRNVGDIDLWGADLAFRARLTNQWELGGSYSHMSEDYLAVAGGSPVALNAPKDKGSLSLNFRDVVSGFNASGRVRFTSSFPAQSADFEGTRCITGGAGGLFEENCVDSYAIFDLNAGYEVPNTAATMQLSVNNVFDTGYRSFVGVPKIGRFAMLRVRYEIF
jgi:iron complex outermembrane receptor protein